MGSSPPKVDSKDDRSVMSAQPSPPPAASESPDPAPAPAKGASATSLEAPDANDPWLASHQMAPDDVLKTVRQQQSLVQACFNEGKKKDPSINGEVKVRFVITNDGQVRDWKDDTSSMTDEEVTTCVGEVLRKLKFPKQKSPGDAWGSYSINFTP